VYKIFKIGNNIINYLLNREEEYQYEYFRCCFRIRHRIKRDFRENLSKIILYGSYARGDYHITSDVDIMILVTLSDEEIKRVENQVFDCAFDLEMKYGVDISPIIKNEIHYEYWVDTLPFYRNIQQEGAVVA